MAFEEDVLDVSFLAGEDLDEEQYHFVKMSASNTVKLVSATTDFIVGVLQNKPLSGQVARVRVYGVSRVMAGGILGFGDIVGADTDGHAIAKTTDKDRYSGVCIQGAGAATNTGTILVMGPSFIANA